MYMLDNINRGEGITHEYTLKCWQYLLGEEVGAITFSSGMRRVKVSPKAKVNKSGIGKTTPKLT